MNLKQLLAYRANFFISMILMGVWVSAYVVLVEVIFYHINSLAGWNKGQTLMILSFYYLLQNLSDMFFKDNIENFDDTMLRGELDFFIIRPASTRLLTFFWQMRWDHIGSMIMTLFLFIYAYKNLTEPLSISFFLIGISLVLVALILYFSILTLIASTSFWIGRNNSLRMLIFNVSQLARYPRQIYTQIIGTIFVYLIPIALLAAVPAEVALSKPPGIILAFFIGITILFWILSRIVWERGMRRYSSAN